jgi:hypothetical protein
LELPVGQTIDNLVPAVGGGFRGITRAGGHEIAGHARLLKATGAGVVTGTALALGPLVGLMALSVTSEMIAQRQLNKKLDAIANGIQSIGRHLQAQDEAALSLADRTISEASAFLLDRVVVPSALGVGPIFADLRKVLEVRLDRLKAWEAAAKWAESRAKKNGAADSGELLERLAGKGKSISSFMAEVGQTYRALALSARIAVLTRIETSVLQPDATIPNVEASVASQLDRIAHDQSRLTDVLGRLSAVALDKLMWFSSCR